MMFSRTAEEILNNLKPYKHKIYFAHKLPIPEAFETPTQKALSNPDITHLWFTEEDMVLPSHILKDMLEMDKAVVTVNYPTTAKGDSSILTIKNRIVYAGTGCTLVKREVFDELKPPYFRDDILWMPKNMGNYIKFIATQRVKDGYGLHDVHFFMRLYELGIPVHKLDYTVGQRKLIALGKAGSNNGAHKIEVWTKVKKDRYFTLRKHLKPEPKSGLVEVEFPNKTIMTSKEHAKKLIKQGLAKKPPLRHVVLDWSGYYEIAN